MMMTSWWLHGSNPSLPHRPIEEVDFGSQLLWVADFTCVRFGFVMLSYGHWHPVLPVELRVRGI
jgi:hypothetical protein